MIAKLMEILKKLWNGKAKIHVDEIAVPELEWHTAELQNGWTGSLQYAKNVLGQAIILGGPLNHNADAVTAHRTIIATLPTEYKPKFNVGLCITANCSNLSPYGGMIGFILSNNCEIRIVDPLAAAVNKLDPAIVFQTIYYTV